MGAKDCIFCKIADGSIPSSKVYEDSTLVAFNDLSPQAPTHILIIPREHIDSLDKAAESHTAILGHLLLTAADIARAKGFRITDIGSLSIQTGTVGRRFFIFTFTCLPAGLHFPPG